MAFELKRPQLGLTMEEGTVSQWIKHEGDAVKAGDVVVEITTDKLTNEITSEQDGVLLKIVAQEGEDVPVKGLLAYIGQPGEQVGAAPTAAVPAAPSASAAPAKKGETSVIVIGGGPGGYVAAIRAAQTRLRPIVMTSLAFIAGVLPLAIATGAGANSRVAIGTGIIGGTLTATLLAVFFVPLFFVLVKRLFTRQRPSQE